MKRAIPLVMSLVCCELQPAFAQPAPTNCRPGVACTVRTLTVTQDAGITGNLAVTGSATYGSVTNTGETVNGNLTVNGDAGVSGNLRVQGELDLLGTSATSTHVAVAVAQGPCVDVDGRAIGGSVGAGICADGAEKLQLYGVGSLGLRIGSSGNIDAPNGNAVLEMETAAGQNAIQMDNEGARIDFAGGTGANVVAGNGASVVFDGGLIVAPGGTTTLTVTGGISVDAVPVVVMEAGGSINAGQNLVLDRGAGGQTTIAGGSSPDNMTLSSNAGSGVGATGAFVFNTVNTLSNAGDVVATFQNNTTPELTLSKSGLASSNGGFSLIGDTTHLAPIITSTTTQQGMEAGTATISAGVGSAVFGVAFSTAPTCVASANTTLAVIACSFDAGTGGIGFDCTSYTGKATYVCVGNK